MDSKKLMYKPQKAYKNISFLEGQGARTLRILSEILHPEEVLKSYEVNKWLCFFGSARFESSDVIRAKIQEIQKQLQLKGTTTAADQKNLDMMQMRLKMSRYYDDAVVLSKMLADWSLTLPKDKRFLICSGGGPGIMEAANRGPHEMGIDSVGLNISLPFEQFSNPYIPKHLNFEFHYFFTRKFWFVYLSSAFVVFPGGYGTLDELFEVLTLIQTRKMPKQIPVLIYGEDFWHDIVNFEKLAEYGVISPEDLDMFCFVNTPKEAFEYLQPILSTQE